MTTNNPFNRDAGVDKPGIVGSRWWNRALVEATPLQGRRSSFLGCGLAIGGILLVGGLAAWGISKATEEDDVREEMRRSLDLQRDYGWNFGATSETVAFNTAYTKAYARGALKTLETDLAPSNPVNKPFYQPALFQAPEALPRLTLPDGETTRVRPLAEDLRPILTPEMETAEKTGRALARLLAKGDVGLILDLAGPLSVAIAAGAANVFDPVFIFENWPHPKAVVPAHQTLAAAVYYQPVFAKAQAERKNTAPPAYVLDRARTATYVDSASSFDNRYIPKLPNAPAMVSKILYVSETLPEASDLNSILNTWTATKVEVRALSPKAFVAATSQPPQHVYGGDSSDASFRCDYGWEECPKGVSKNSVPANQSALAYKPAPKPTVTPPAPTGIGYAPVIIAAGTGLLLGAKLNRNGSWNRSSGGWGG